MKEMHVETSSAGDGPNWWIWGPVALVVAFFGYGFIVNSTPEGKERSRARDAIRLCWDEQSRKSLSSGSQQFIAGACESMERDYTSRYQAKP
jgi:hypothetical protein